MLRRTRKAERLEFDVAVVEPCGCGCERCGDSAPKTREQEIAELLTLRQSVDKRLTELSNG